MLLSLILLAAVQATPTPVVPVPMVVPKLPPAVVAWFNRGDCPPHASLTMSAPKIKNPRGDFTGADHLNLKGDENIGAAYDPVHHLAVRAMNDSVGSSYVLRAMNVAPPPGVKRVDLSAVRLKAGIRIGTPAATVVALLGKPSISNMCGKQLYSYVDDTYGTMIGLIIKDGRVFEISWDTLD